MVQGAVDAKGLSASALRFAGFAGGKINIIALAVSILVIVAGSLAWHYFRTAKKIAYITAPVTIGTVSRSVSATGTVNPVLTIIVGSYVSGAIQQLYCDYNTRVQKGQVCAKIDPRPYQTIVDQTMANLAVAKAQLDKDKSNLVYLKIHSDRYTKLAATEGVSQDAADDARNSYNQAVSQIAYDEATIAQRQAELDAALVNLEYTNIISPVDGTVVSRNVTMGQTVASSFQTPTLFLIAADLTQMQVDTNVSESDIGGVKVGNRAIFTVDAFPQRVFEGTVVQVRQSPQTVQNVVTFDIVVSVANTDLALKPGLTASTRITLEERRDVTRVPDQAIRYRPSKINPEQESSRQTAGTQLWVLRDGKPVPVAIKTGLDDDSFTEILAGVRLGDQVILAEQVAGGSPKVPQPRL